MGAIECLRLGRCHSFFRWGHFIVERQLLLLCTWQMHVRISVGLLAHTSLVVALRCAHCCDAKNHRVINSKVLALFEAIGSNHENKKKKQKIEKK